jgi:hypothetical protein
MGKAKRQYRIVKYVTKKHKTESIVLPVVFDSYEDAEKYAETKGIRSYNIQTFYVD